MIRRVVNYMMRLLHGRAVLLKKEVGMAHLLKSELDIHKIADFYLSLAAEHGDILTHLKLQKLLYYSQAWYLALKGSPLFSDNFEAWIHGPANRSIFRRFKDYEYHPISECPTLPKLPLSIVKHLIQVFKVYGGRSALELELMTHKEPPWRRAREGYKPDESCRKVISLDEMKTYYRSRVS